MQWYQVFFRQSIAVLVLRPRVYLAIYVRTSCKICLKKTVDQGHDQRLPLLLEWLLFLVSEVGFYII